MLVTTSAGSLPVCSFQQVDCQGTPPEKWNAEDQHSSSTVPGNYNGI